MPVFLDQILDRLHRYLWHLWGAPREVPLTCPVIPGTPVDPTGFFDNATVDSALDWTGWVSLASVIVLVVLCYNATRYTTGPWFERRWAKTVVVSAIVAFLIPLIVLLLSKTRAAPGTFETDPSPFQAVLPLDFILLRASAGLLWGPIAFVIVSLILTQTMGRFDWGGGFFHNRGCPWPRLFPSKG